LRVRLPWLQLWRPGRGSLRARRCLRSGLPTSLWAATSRLEARVAVFNRNEGANTMAGTAPRALALSSHASPFAPSRTAQRSASLVGNEVSIVYRSRRQADGLAVLLTIGNGPLVLNGGLPPGQARAMAHGLVAAADAAESQQQGGAR